MSTLTPVVEEVEQAPAPTAGPTEAVPELPAESQPVDFTGSPDLDQLSSYRLAFAIEFEGTSGGQPAEGYIEVNLESTKDPPATYLAMTMEGSTVEEVGGTNSLEFYDVGGTIYLYNAAGDDQWVSFPGTGEAAFTEGFFNPGETLVLPNTAVCDPEPEDINGILATHCFFTEQDVGRDKATYVTLSGDVWVAIDGGYIVRYEIEARGYQPVNQAMTGDLFDSGDVRFEYELSDVNADLTITPPDEALNAQGFDLGTDAGDGELDTPELPLLEDAEELFSVAGITNYYTNVDVAAAVDFYRQELAVAGWIENVDEAYVDETTGLLSFGKDGTTLIITLDKEADGRVNVGLITSE